MSTGELIVVSMALALIVVTWASIVGAILLRSIMQRRKR